MSSQLAVLIATTALLGVRQRLLTRFSQPLPGMPSSRLKAKSIRPADAIDEKPQKVMAKATPADRIPPSAERPAPRFDSRMYWTPPPPPLLASTSAGLVILSVRATRTM